MLTALYKNVKNDIMMIFDGFFFFFASICIHSSSSLSIDDAVPDWPKEVYDQIYETYVCPPNTFGDFNLTWSKNETITSMHFVNELIVPQLAVPKADGYYEIAVRKVKQQILPGIETEILAYGVPGDDASFRTPGPSLVVEANQAIKVRWINEIESPHPLALYIDMGIHWANPSCSQFPCKFGTTPSYNYTGPVPITTHLHGGTSDEESDGHPLAWYLPANGVPDGYSRHGLFYDEFQRSSSTGNDWTNNSMVAEYNETVPKVLWYHDHTLGITRLNVYAGLYGVFQVQGGEGDVDILPAGDFQMPLIFQDKIFNTDGSSLSYPVHADQEGLNIPLCGEPTCNGGGLSDVPHSWMPAFFGDISTVNGLAWPNLEVAQSCYRFNVLIASLFQTYRIQLQLNNGTKLPFTVVGSDQGWTRQSYTLKSVELSPSERVVLLVDFSSLFDGDEIFVVNAMPCVGTQAATTNGTMPLSKMFYQMRFSVNSSLPASSTRCPSNEELDPLLAARISAEFQDLDEADPMTTRDISFHILNSASVITNRSAGTTTDNNIVEIKEACGVDISDYASSQVVTQKPEPISAQLAVIYLLGELGVPRHYVSPITIYPRIGEPEWWLYENLSPNAHPMHVHEGAFLLNNRTFSLPNNLTISGLPPRGWENGPKDTIMVYQYSNASTKKVFFSPGLFMYHCHILTHEDRDMMRPFCVTSASGELTKACKLHGYDHCTFPPRHDSPSESPSTTSSTHQLYSTPIVAAAVSVVATILLYHPY